MAYQERELTRMQVNLRAVSHHVSLWLGRRFPDAIPLVLVCGYPRSGTVWATQLVADYLQAPFLRDSLLPVGCRAVFHTHLNLKRTDRQAAYVVRDVRDTLVSQYFFLAREVPEGRCPRVPRFLRPWFAGVVDKNDIRGNLPWFIERLMRRPLGAAVHWGRHVQAFYELNRPDFPVMRYEAMLADAAAVLTQTVQAMTDEPADARRVACAVDKYAFSSQAGRKPGSENRASHMRKATTGEWRTCFSREAAQVLDRHCGRMLIQAGYESNHDWVNSCPA